MYVVPYGFTVYRVDYTESGVNQYECAGSIFKIVWLDVSCMTPVVADKLRKISISADNPSRYRDTDGTVYARYEDILR